VINGVPSTAMCKTDRISAIGSRPAEFLRHKILPRGFSSKIFQIYNQTRFDGFQIVE
jgi:hypothetical protein